MSDLRVRRWSAEEFLANRARWQSLLARTAADPLFMSWDWVSAWWRHHRSVVPADLWVLGVYTQDDELCGIAPFYLHRAVHRGFLTARRLELLGNMWRDSRVTFSEYLDVIARQDLAGAVCDALRQSLEASAEWDELVLCNLRSGSVAEQLAGSLGDHCYLRQPESMTGWSIDLPESFDAFVARLSSNTRRKVVNQREKLAGVSFQHTPAALRRAALDRLDGFVARRFAPAGNPCTPHAPFHADLIEHWPGEGSVQLTELRAGELCISVMLNLRVADTEYYLQSGFDDAHARGLSPGLLHMGYAIEAACGAGVRRFDFLAGQGRNRDYKRDFAARSAPLHTLQVVRKPSLRLLFRAFDRLRGHTSHKTRVGG